MFGSMVITNVEQTRLAPSYAIAIPHGRPGHLKLFVYVSHKQYSVVSLIHISHNIVQHQSSFSLNRNRFIISYI